MENRFGTILRRRRKRLGLTAQAVADIMGHSVCYITDIERARRNPLRGEAHRRWLGLLGLDEGRMDVILALDRGKAVFDKKDGKSAFDIALALLRRRNDLTDGESGEIMRILKTKGHSI